jgi:hypothetical protein
MIDKREAREHLEALEADLHERGSQVETVAETGSACAGVAGTAAINDADERARHSPLGCCVVSRRARIIDARSTSTLSIKHVQTRQQ